MNKSMSTTPRLMSDQPALEQALHAIEMYQWSSRSTAPSAMHIEVRNFVLHFIKGYYKVAWHACCITRALFHGSNSKNTGKSTPPPPTSPLQTLRFSPYGWVLFCETGSWRMNCSFFWVHLNISIKYWDLYFPTEDWMLLQSIVMAHNFLTYSWRYCWPKCWRCSWYWKNCWRNCWRSYNWRVAGRCYHHCDCYQGRKLLIGWKLAAIHT